MPWTGPTPAAVFALGAAAAWGSGDFTGGVAARRVGPFHTIFLSYGIGLLALASVAVVRGEPIPPRTDLIWGALAGLIGVVGLGFLLRGFAAARMGIVAPVSGVLAAAVPVVFAAFSEGLPRGGQGLGFILALAGIWLLATPEPGGGRPAGVGVALLAGVAFGGFFIALDRVGEGAVFWPLVAGRLAACGAMAAFALSVRRPLIPAVLPLALLVAVGMLDVAGNVFFLLAVHSGRLDVAAVLGSLYPAVTAILARVIARERLTRPQVTGVGIAVLAIALITR